MKNKSRVKTYIAHARITEYERKWLELLANKKQVTISEMLRILIAEAVDKAQS